MYTDASGQSQVSSSIVSGLSDVFGIGDNNPSGNTGDETLGGNGADVIDSESELLEAISGVNKELLCALLNPDTDKECLREVFSLSRNNTLIDRCRPR